MSHTELILTAYVKVKLTAYLQLYSSVQTAGIWFERRDDGRTLDEVFHG